MTGERRSPSAEDILGFLEEPDFGDLVDPEVGGFILLEPLEDATRYVALIRPGLAEWQLRMFAEWAESRFARFIEHGPEPDGWQKRESDSGWQLWGRLVEMPRLG